MSNPIIQIKGLNASYDHNPVLSQVNMSVYERDFLGIIGPNGGGKTTLIKCILGLHQFDKGNITFYKNGKEVYGIVGTTQKDPDYGLYLEYGTSDGRIAPRPWLKPAMRKNNDFIRTAIAKAVQNTLTGGNK